MNLLRKNHAGPKGTIFWYLDCIYEALPYNTRRLLFSIIAPNKYKSLQERKERIISDMECYKPFMDSRSIFFHIPKTAGISITRALYGDISGNHASIRKFQLIFTKDEFNNFYKFAFVRNPWDRVYSAYNFLKHGGFNEHDKKWVKNNLEIYSDFNEFVCDWINTANIWKYPHFMPQYWYICQPLSTKIKVDFVARFEQIKPDFKIIAQEIYPEKVINLQHCNKNNDIKNTPYIDAYNERSKIVIADIYKTDIELFNYQFDG